MASFDTTHNDRDNDNDNDNDNEITNITNKMRTTQISPRPPSRPPSRLTIETPTEPNNPVEDDFIDEYFKDRTGNQKIQRIYEKYLEVKNSFEDNLPEIYNNLNEEDKGTIKKEKSLGWEIILNDKQFDRKSFLYTIDKQFVTKTNDEKTIFKEIQFNKVVSPQTLFMVTLEITMQKMAYDIVNSEDNVKIPKINQHYLVGLDNYGSCKIIIEMEFIEHKQLNKNNVDKAMNALDKLRFNNIFHFDTHHDNIVQSIDDNKVVILDFGKAQINKNPDISSSSGLFKPKPEFSKTVDFNYDNWITRKILEPTMRTNVDFYGGIKKKYKHRKYTRKISKKRKSKKTKSKKTKRKSKKIQSKNK